MNKKRIVVGMLAHVDAGKTTLSEAVLYVSGMIRKLGRVDNQDTFLDTNEMERKRGITIFSKQAIMEYEGMEFVLLDTPGHTDFSAEMERTLQVLDYAVLVISAADGVQGHTLTLWKLLKQYKIPVFLFINKMDQPGMEREALQRQLQEKLGDSCIDILGMGKEELFEELSLCHETLLEKYLEDGELSEKIIAQAIKNRFVFPCFYGSALKQQGIKELLDGMRKYVLAPKYLEKFSARVFKISRDDKGARITHLKITGGSLQVKELLSGKDRMGEEWSEKIDQIRFYSGEKFTLEKEAVAGMVCCVTGLTKTYPGEGLGEETEIVPILEPVMTYQIGLPDDCHAAQMLPKLRELEEEIPELHIVWQEELQEIDAQLMGEVQTEIITNIVMERYGVKISFLAGRILYKETITDTVEGVGHFEPLRHYAEVHLKLEPLPAGSGMEFTTDCSEDLLSKNWQRLIMTHLQEKEHRGVLVGATLTDAKITLVAGKAHQKHTEGGDFRQATYRAVRQGLMQAQSKLLEPWYHFQIEVPENMVGRVMTDVERRNGTSSLEQSGGGVAILTGRAPVATFQDYSVELSSFSKGQGKIQCEVEGYFDCHNEEEVLESTTYDPERDLSNPADSVFCSHGAGYVVPWYEVPEHMHLDFVLGKEQKEEEVYVTVRENILREKEEQLSLGVEEIDAILAKAGMSNKRNTPKKRVEKRVYRAKTTGGSSKISSVKQEEYLLVDGYNVIFAWHDLNELAKQNIDSARDRLIEILCDYQGMRRCELIVVFDAYRVVGHQTEYLDYKNIHIVYTKEAETADQYIERFTHENGKKYRITVATSDGLEQIIIRGQGCLLLSAREFEKEYADRKKRLTEEVLEQQKMKEHRLLDALSEKDRLELEKIEQ